MDYIGSTCYDVEGDVGDDHVFNVYDGDNEQEHLGADDEAAAGLQDADEEAGAGCHCHHSYQLYQLYQPTSNHYQTILSSSQTIA